MRDQGTSGAGRRPDSEPDATVNEQDQRIAEFTAAQAQVHAAVQAAQGQQGPHGGQATQGTADRRLADAVQRRDAAARAHLDTGVRPTAGPDTDTDTAETPRTGDGERQGHERSQQDGGQLVTHDELPAVELTPTAPLHTETGSGAALTDAREQQPTPARPGSPGWNAAWAVAEPVIRSHTWVDPVSRPPDPERPGHTTQYAVRSKFDVRRFEYEGERFTDLTVKIALEGREHMPSGVWDKVLSGVEEFLNTPDHRLPDGDRLHVTVVPTDRDPHPGGLTVRFVGRDQPMTRSVWWADADPIDYAHEIAHQLGLRDESPDDTAPHRPTIEGSLLGEYALDPPPGLINGGLRDRHLHLLAAHIGDLTDTTPAPAGSGRIVPLATVSRSFGAEPHAPVQPTPPTAPPVEPESTVPAPGPGPVTAPEPAPVTAPVLPPEPASALVKAPGKPAAKAKEWITTWINTTLDRTHPPRLDRDYPAPSGARRMPTTFPDGSRMPAYIDDVQSLLPDMPQDLLGELLRSPASFGQSDLALRGVEDIVREIDEWLTDRPLVTPAKPKPGGPNDIGLMADVTRAFTLEPNSVTGEGQSFVYSTADGTTLTLVITARHYGNWGRFADAYGDPTKVDTMHRAVGAAGQSKNVQSVTQVGLNGPLGPVSSAAFSGFGRLNLRFTFTNRVGYAQTDQGTNQMETRTLDGSHVHLDDVYYDVRVTGADGQVMETPEPAPPITTTPITTTPLSTTSATTTVRAAPARFGFAMHDGLTVRLPDSVTKVVDPGRIPRSIQLDGRSAFRFVRTEGFGPVRAIRDWAAGQIGTRPGSAAYRELDAFFSTSSFQRLSRTMSHGRVTTVPLFADDKQMSPLGAFVVNVVATRATLITETPNAEMRDINTSLVRNGRSLAKGTSLGIDGVAGPAFNLFDPEGTDGAGGLNLRFQIGAYFRYVFSVTRSAALGGTGAIKSSGWVKGDLTGLYLIKKTVYVQRTGSGGPPEQFHTWSVDRMTRTEARRLAGWDDGTRLRLDNGGLEPFAPAYLIRDHPPTLGMHRVEEFSFDDGSRTQDAADGFGRTLLDTFADRVIAAVSAAYPGLVAPLDQLAPPVRRGLLDRARSLLEPDDPQAIDRSRTTQWSDVTAYRTALANTLEILNALNHRNMAGNLEALATTGIRIRLTELGAIGRGHRYIWLHGDLTGRRFEGTQDDLKLRYSPVGVERIDAQKSARRVAEAGIDAQAAFRDPAGGDIGVPNNAGILSVGLRAGRQTDAETGFGSTATNEHMSLSIGPAHLHRYDLSLTVTRGGYWRVRGLLRGVATLGLPATQPFVISQRQDVLIGLDQHRKPVGGGPVTGQVLISIPDKHAPAVDPHQPGALNPYVTLRDPLVPEQLTSNRARALALGDLSRPGSLIRTDDLVGADTHAGQDAEKPGAVESRGLGPTRGSQLFRDLQNHPFSTVSVVAPPSLLSSLSAVLERASGGAWQLTEEGTPTREAVLRAFKPQYLTANFDQTSGALGWSASGLMGKGPYSNLWATFRHLTVVDGITVLTKPVPMDAENILGGTHQASGKTVRTSTISFGGQLTYAKSHAVGPGVLGNYAIVASPWSTANSKSSTVTRTVVADMNRKGFTHQILVSGTVEHWLALASSLLGTAAVGKPFVPRWLAGAAGEMTSVPGGWLAHVPEKSAHRIGLIDDGMGDIPRYTRQTWSPQPWLRGNSFGTYPVNHLDTTAVLSAFDRRVRGLGLDDAGSERVRTLVTSRVLRSLNKEMSGSGSSVPVSTGRWGWHTLRIGSRYGRVRVELIPGESTFQMLDHSVEMEQNRRAVETVQESSDSSRGTDFGIVVTEGVSTGNPTAVASGPTYTATDTDRRAVSSNTSASTLKIFRLGSTEPYAEIATPYRLRITLEVDDAPAQDGGQRAPGTRRTLREQAVAKRDQFRGKRTVSEEGDVGTLVEHIPLSLMTPDQDAVTGGAALLEAPVLTGLAAPRAGTADDAAYVLHPHTRHGDGEPRPFVFPPHGFDVRRIVGQDEIQAANHYAIALSYDVGFSLTQPVRPGGPGALERAKDTGLTRLGTGSAQALEDGSSNATLSVFFHRALLPGGYGIPGLTEKNLIDTESAQLDLYAKPDFSGARLLTVADGQKMEVLSRVSGGASTSVNQESGQDSALGGGVAVSSPETGFSQLGASTTGPYAGESHSTLAAAENLASLNVKPKTGRAFLFAIPTAWLSVADVQRGIKDTRIGKWVRGTFGHIRPGLKTARSDAYTLAWMRDDIARQLGLISDTNFPPRVSKAWDAVNSASKAFVDADKAYWKKRRTAIDLREALDTARQEVDSARADPDLRTPHDSEPAHDGRREQHEAAVRQLAEATGRRDEALAAFEARRTQLDALRETAENAATEYHRARAATDQLTRWHQLAATEGGRRQLDGRIEPPEVTHQAPPKPVTAPKTPAPAPAAYTVTTTDTGTLLTSPSPAQEKYAVHDVPRDGDAFYHALAQGLARTDPKLLTEKGIDLADPPTAVARLRELLTGSLTDPANVDLLEHVTADERDTFTVDEITAVGAEHAGLAPGTQGRREFDALGGPMPHSVTPASAARAALAAAQIRRPGAAAAETGWNHSAADLLPLLAARTFGVEVTVVGDAGRFQDFTVGAQQGARPRVVLLLSDRHYQVALPVHTGATPPPAGHSSGGTAPKSTMAPPPSGPPPGPAARGGPVQVPGTGECLLFAFMASDPEHVRSRLPGLSTTNPAAYNWLANPEGVRTQVRWQATAERPSAVMSDVAGAMRAAARDYVTAAGSRLPAQIVGQLRLTTADESAARIDRPGRKELLQHLDHHDVDRETLEFFGTDEVRARYIVARTEEFVLVGMVPQAAATAAREAAAGLSPREAFTHLRDHGLLRTVSDLDDAELSRLLTTAYPQSIAPLDADETRAVLAAVEDWRGHWMTPVGEVFLPLLAHAFDVRVDVAQPDAAGGAQHRTHVGPDYADRRIEVHYNGTNHYDASDAEPRDLLTFGEAVAPERVKQAEKDDRGDVRINPLWVPVQVKTGAPQPPPPPPAEPGPAVRDCFSEDLMPTLHPRSTVAEPRSTE
ncbi:hypothetical protein [Streptomyces sp. NPDC053726]|uniref:hypothetical protein n=1 Tax=Streptomyces sp. NPDC053726 TaxID=3365713 RepID=UPI0037D0D58F